MEIMGGFMKIEKLAFGGALLLAAQATPALAEVVEGESLVVRIDITIWQSEHIL